MYKRNSEISIRKYKPSDCKDILKLFYDTVHEVNTKDYSKEQLDVWATGLEDEKLWNVSLLNNYSVVAIKDGIIVGFGDIDKTGFLNRLFVHKNYQKLGVATQLCDKLENKVEIDSIITHASVTAKLFFENRGYKVVKNQEVIRKGVVLVNYIMKKTI